jgi:hypothetical protein
MDLIVSLIQSVFEIMMNILPYRNPYAILDVLVLVIASHVPHTYVHSTSLQIYI